MRNNPPFRAFARRVTVGYALLAILLVGAVVVATSVIACMLYIGSVDDTIETSVAKAKALAAQYESQGLTLPDYAPQIVDALERSKVHVFVVDEFGHPLAGNAPHDMTMPPPRHAHALGAMFGLHPGFARVHGGTIVVMPDIEDLSQLFERYLIVVVPFSLLAMGLAWFVGRRITARAIAPLSNVTLALRRIAGGDFAPEPLLDGNVELRDLTSAYNDVAYRLTAATAERERNELQMRQFIADAGHELRTPLTVIMGYLEMLQQGAVSDPAGVTRVQSTMLSESRRMRTVIDKLIFLARMERPEATRNARFELTATVRRVVEALEPLAAGRIAFGDAAPADVLGDEGEIYEAIKNVVENAVRYAPGSPVDVSLTIVAGTVRIVVTDDGPGMSDEEIDHAFDRFYRGHAPSANGDPIEGSGLGLAIAKRALERAGGTISIERHRTTGTSVAMTLPAL